ncbi:MAG: GNAT family N-acetyltransferase [Cyanophyceae cyanobacterium]
MEPAMNPDVYQVFYGDRWQATQQQAVDQVCADVDNPTWVAILSGEIVGFIAIKLHHEGRMGEIYMVAMVAVDPDFQGQGVGGALIQLL